MILSFPCNTVYLLHIEPALFCSKSPAVLSCPDSHFISQRRILGQNTGSCCKIPGISGLAQKAVFSVADIFPGSPVVCAYNRYAAGHTLQSRHAKALPEGREKEDIYSLKEKIQVPAESQKNYFFL